MVFSKFNRSGVRGQGWRRTPMANKRDFEKAMTCPVHSLALARFRCRRAAVNRDAWNNVR